MTAQTLPKDRDELDDLLNRRRVIRWTFVDQAENCTVLLNGRNPVYERWLQERRDVEFEWRTSAPGEIIARWGHELLGYGKWWYAWTGRMWESFGAADPEATGVKKSHSRILCRQCAVQGCDRPRYGLAPACHRCAEEIEALQAQAGERDWMDTASRKFAWGVLALLVVAVVDQAGRKLGLW